MKVDLTAEEAAWLEMLTTLLCDNGDERASKAGQTAGRKLRGALERAGCRREGNDWRMPNKVLRG